MKEEIPKPKKNFSLESVFDFLYLVILLGLVAYGVYVFIHDRGNYHADELIRLSYYYIPAFVFALVGIMKVRSDRSLIYAILSSVVAFVLMVFFYSTIYPMI